MFYGEGLREQMRAVMEAQSQDDVVVRLAKRHGANSVSATLATLHAEFPGLCELVVTPPFTRFSPRLPLAFTMKRSAFTLTRVAPLRSRVAHRSWQFLASGVRRRCC